MSNLKESIVLLEKVFSRLEIYLSKLKDENSLLHYRLSQKNETLEKLNEYRSETINKLKDIKRILSNEMKAELLHAENQKNSQPQKNDNDKINILMSDE